MTDYRSDIDGLRAIAVLSVLLFHYGASWLPGGFVGVDVFFVISGFLITKHLFEDISKNGYSLGPLLVRFYNKRIRRIIPALAVVLLSTLAAGWYLLMPGDFASTGKSAAYSAFGLGNLYFYWNTGYFDREAELQPLLHMWSLGVEEQFYLLWPVLLALIMWVARGRRLVIGTVIAVLIVVGLAFSMQTVAVDPKAAFFLPLPRAWELGIGGLLAFLPAMRSRWASEGAGIIGIALVAWPLFMLAGAETSLGLSMLPAVVGSALIIWPRAESVVSRLLSARPMRGIGLISYSLYLWHWPVIVLFRHYNNGAMPTLIEAAVLATISMVLAYISWRFIEGPARRMKAPSWATITIGLTTAAFIAFASQSVAQNGGFANRVSPDVQKLASLEVMWQWDCPQQVEVPELGGKFCAFGAPWETAKVRGILWGDSHAEHFAPIVEAAIGDRSVSVLLYRMCPAALGGAVRRVWAEEPNYVKFCSSSRQRAASWLTTADIQLVLLSASWQSLTAYVSQDGTLPDAMTMADLVKEGTSDLIQKISKDGRQIIILGQVPVMPEQGLSCGIIQATKLLRRKGICSQIESVVYEANSGEMVLVDDKLASISSAFFISALRTLCRNDKCVVFLNGEFLHRDVTHLRRNLRIATRRDLANLIGLTAAIRSTSPSSAAD